MRILSRCGYGVVEAMVFWVVVLGTGSLQAQQPGQAALPMGEAAAGLQSRDPCLPSVDRATGLYWQECRTWDSDAPADWVDRMLVVSVGNNGPFFSDLDAIERREYSRQAGQTLALVEAGAIPEDGRHDEYRRAVFQRTAPRGAGEERTGGAGVPEESAGGESVAGDLPGHIEIKSRYLPFRDCEPVWTSDRSTGLSGGPWTRRLRLESGETVSVRVSDLKSWGFSHGHPDPVVWR